MTNYPTSLTESPYRTILQIIGDKRKRKRSLISIFDAVQEILNKYVAELPFPVSWERLKHLYNNFTWEYTLTRSELTEMMGQIDRIANYANFVAHIKGETRDIKAIKQWVRNVNTFFSYVPYSKSDDLTDPKLRLILRNRDS